MTCARRFACRAAIEPVTGGEAIVAAPADGRYAVTASAVGRRSRHGRPDRSAGSSRVSPTAATIARRSPPPSPKRRRRSSGATRELARAERLLGGTRRAGAPRRGCATRGGGRGGAADGRPGAARAARSGAGQRRRRRIGQCLRPARTDRRPRRRGLRGTRRLVRRRRTALPDRPHRRVELQAQVPPADVAASRAPSRRSRFEVPACPMPIDAEARPRARRRRDRSEDARAAAADRGGEPGTASCSSARPAPPCCTPAPTQRVAGRAAGGRADGSRPTVRLRADQRREVRPALRRDGVARRRPRRHSRAASSPAIAS